MMTGYSFWIDWKDVDFNIKFKVNQYINIGLYIIITRVSIFSIPPIMEFHRDEIILSVVIAVRHKIFHPSIQQ